MNFIGTLTARADPKDRIIPEINHVFEAGGAGSYIFHIENRTVLTYSQLALHCEVSIPVKEKSQPVGINLQELLDEELLTDAVIKTKDNGSIPVHKAILAFRSEVNKQSPIMAINGNDKFS